MSKNRIVTIFLAMCLILGTVPFALGATDKTSASTSSIYISALDVGSSGEKPYQEYVKITNDGKTSVNLKGWKIKEKDAKHTYTFSSYTLKSKASVTLKSGSGKNSGSTLYWNKYSFNWNDEGDTAYLYNAQGILVSSKTVADQTKPKITITHVPSYGVSGSASGTVKGVTPSKYKVAVYIYVNGWWNKPNWNSPLTNIKCSGAWSCDVDTGGNDIYATQVAAFLVPAKYVPPKMAGGKSLPSALYKNSVANTKVKR